MSTKTFEKRLHRSQMDSLRAKLDKANAEILELKQDMFYQSAIRVTERDCGQSLELVGWYDSCAESSLMGLGDELVEAGVFEKHPNGYGRRWFYRPISS